ncbi:MAG TPA: GDP-mannose 4,6-dehydratase, partial [Solirubrobacteraceae bacterium]|nr:GDP-mannose 4,6-dehydratase [Solirubrobacteraceae bacterium]
MRVLITGASGFAGGHLAVACAAAGDDVVGLSRSGRASAAEGRAVEGLAVDLRDAVATRKAVCEAEPDVIYHLAALSSVGRSWEEPARTMTENTATAVNVLEAVRHQAPTARVVWVSSCEVYAAEQPLPITEDGEIGPATPYAVSKTASDLLARVYAEAYGLDLVRVRPFNHAGPGQLPIFVLSSLARQAAEARRSRADEIRIVTGSPDTRRDFTDVRDVVRAYRLLAEPGTSGVYNVSSGTSVSTTDQISLLAELIAPTRIEHVVDPALIRAHEVMDRRGSHERLTADTGWEPEIPLRQTMADTVAWWEAHL